MFKSVVGAVAAVGILAAVVVGGASAASSVAGVFGGTATFDLQGGTVQAQVSGLTKNVGGYGYIGWLVNESTGAKLNVGVLSATGADTFTGANLAAGGYTVYVVTFEPATNTSNTPAGDPVAKAAVVAKGTSPIASAASGTVDASDASVSAQVTGLAKLPTGYEYVGWLVNESTGAKLNLGVLTAAGANTYTGSGLSRGGYTAYVVTYEPTGNTSNEPKGEPVAKGAVSIAGSAPVAPAAGAGLPRTGTGPRMMDGGVLNSTLIAVLAAAGVLLILGGGVATRARRWK